MKYLLLILLFSGCSRSSPTDEFIDYYPVSTDEEETVASYYDTKTLDACNLETGNCYTLDIDFFDGEVTTINFPNGGYREVYDSDCSYNTCMVVDEDGTEWEIIY